MRGKAYVTVTLTMFPGARQLAVVPHAAQVVKVAPVDVSVVAVSQVVVTVISPAS